MTAPFVRIVASNGKAYPITAEAASPCLGAGVVSPLLAAPATFSEADPALALRATPPAASMAVPASIRARGFAAIGLHLAKDKHNIGGVIRAASCYGAASIALSGERIGGDEIKAPANTTAGQRHIPVMRGDLRALIPYGAVPVAVDLVEDAECLTRFVHPQSAFYVFGPEDGTLGRDILAWCPRRVMVPTRFCMNLAATVNVVLYDRLAKQLRAAQ